MGFFGFFVSVIGLGAMTTDAISNSIFTSKNYKKAKTNGDPYYSGVGSKIFETNTGRRCYYEYDFSTNHNVLVDVETGEIVNDITDLKNQKKTLEEKRYIEGTDCVFYRTHEFDDQKHKTCNIYRCTTMPGFFKKIEINNVDRYVKGEVTYDCIWGHRIDTGNINEEIYFSDGTRYSKAKAKEMSSDCERSRAIKKGKVILPYKDDDIEGFKDVNTGEFYINYEYYFPVYQTASQYPKKRWFGNGREYRKAKMVPGKDVGFTYKKFVLVPVDGSKVYNDRGEEIVR